LGGVNGERNEAELAGTARQHGEGQRWTVDLGERN